MEGPFAILRDCLRADEPVALATVIELASDGAGPRSLPVLGAKIVVRPDCDPLGSLGEPGLDRVVVRDVQGALDSGRSVTRRYGPHGEPGGTEITVFVEVFAPPRRMLIFGAVDFTAALVRIAKVLGYHVTVCDARPVFATRARFPDADEVVADWPHRHLATVANRLGPNDAICVLTHDHKFDIPATRVGVEHKGRVYRRNGLARDPRGPRRTAARRRCRPGGDPSHNGSHRHRHRRADP